MDQRIKKEWTEALRSGNFPQVQKRLRSPEGFCCLGVLCEIAVADGVLEPARLRTEDEDDHYYTYNGASAVLPHGVIVWASMETEVSRPEGFEDTYDKVRGELFPRDRVTLARLNDAGYTFDQIADIIEAEL